jgi:hypothetical protein
MKQATELNCQQDAVGFMILVLLNAQWHVRVCMDKLTHLPA